jgi:hypothetical protein
VRNKQKKPFKTGDLVKSVGYPNSLFIIIDLNPSITFNGNRYMKGTIRVELVHADEKDARILCLETGDSLLLMKTKCYHA